LLNFCSTTTMAENDDSEENTTNKKVSSKSSKSLKSSSSGRGQHRQYSFQEILDFYKSYDLEKKRNPHTSDAAIIRNHGYNYQTAKFWINNRKTRTDSYSAYDPAVLKTKSRLRGRPMEAIESI